MSSGFEEAAENGAVIVEWPERVGALPTAAATRSSWPRRPIRRSAA